MLHFIVALGIEPSTSDIKLWALVLGLLLLLLMDPYGLGFISIGFWALVLGLLLLLLMDPYGLGFISIGF